MKTRCSNTIIFVVAAVIFFFLGSFTVVAQSHVTCGFDKPNIGNNCSLPRTYGEVPPAGYTNCTMCEARTVTQSNVGIITNCNTPGGTDCTTDWGTSGQLQQRYVNDARCNVAQWDCLDSGGNQQYITVKTSETLYNCTAGSTQCVTESSIISQCPAEWGDTTGCVLDVIPPDVPPSSPTPTSPPPTLPPGVTLTPTLTPAPTLVLPDCVWPNYCATSCLPGDIEQPGYYCSPPTGVCCQDGSITPTQVPTATPVPTIVPTATIVPTVAPPSCAGLGGYCASSCPLGSTKYTGTDCSVWPNIYCCVDLPPANFYPISGYVYESRSGTDYAFPGAKVLLWTDRTWGLLEYSDGTFETGAERITGGSGSYGFRPVKEGYNYFVALDTSTIGDFEPIGSTSYSFPNLSSSQANVNFRVKKVNRDFTSLIIKESAGGGSLPSGVPNPDTTKYGMSGLKSDTSYPGGKNYYNPANVTLNINFSTEYNSVGTVGIAFIKKGTTTPASLSDIKTAVNSGNGVLILRALDYLDSTDGPQPPCYQTYEFCRNRYYIYRNGNWGDAGGSSPSFNYSDVQFRSVVFNTNGTTGTITFNTNFLSGLGTKDWDTYGYFESLGNIKTIKKLRACDTSTPQKCTQSYAPDSKKEYDFLTKYLSGLLPIFRFLY